MEIYIVRHAVAEDVSHDGSDEARQLTSEGKKKMKEAAAGFARMERKIDRIFASPLVRAHQTAEILGTALARKVEIMKELAPAHSPAEVCERLRAMAKLNGIMLVGHEPNCSDLASYLLTGSEHMNIEFKKGSICLIEARGADAGSGDLIWHLSPQTLRLMAG